MVVTRGKEGEGRANWIKEIIYMVTEGNQTTGDKHTLESIGIKLQCTLEIYIRLLTNVTSIKKLKC